MISMDNSVGSVLAKLEELELSDETIVYSFLTMVGMEV